MGTSIDILLDILDQILPPELGFNNIESLSYSRVTKRDIGDKDRVPFWTWSAEKNMQFLGQSGGKGWARLARRKSDSNWVMDRCTELGRMNSTSLVVLEVPFSSMMWDKASGLVFLDPGLYDRTKSNRQKNNAHLARLGLRC